MKPDIKVSINDITYKGEVIKTVLFVLITTSFFSGCLTEKSPDLKNFKSVTEDASNDTHRKIANFLAPDLRLKACGRIIDLKDELYLDVVFEDSLHVDGIYFYRFDKNEKRIYKGDYSSLDSIFRNIDYAKIFAPPNEEFDGYLLRLNLRTLCN